MVWAAFEDALNACFVSLLLRVGCCQIGSTSPFGGNYQIPPFCGSYRAWNRAWGLGRPSQYRVWTPMRGPGPLLETEVRVWEPPQKVEEKPHK